jgi:signal transduction histidine kinase/DNA-binding response OmpR family regulator
MANVDRTNILIVDDLPEKALVLESVLESLGQNLVIARSGREALRYVLDQDFAVILLDVNMPDIDGFETAELIRQRKRSAHTPIIFVTAFSDDVHTARGYSLGAVDYILSPVSPEILRTKVGVFVDLCQKTEQIRRQAEERVVLAREQAARAAAEENSRRSAFLAQASAALASSLDYSATVQNLIRLTLPFLGDVSWMVMLDDLGNVHQADFAWAREGGEIRADSRPASPCPHGALERLLRRAIDEKHAALAIDLELDTDNRWAWEATELADEQNRLPDFFLTSALCVPLIARGQTMGALALAMGPSRRHYTESDLTLVEDLAHRAATALDNARLYRDIQEADHRKNEFLAMLAHELRNPLAPIRSAVHILRLRGAEHPEVSWAQDLIDRQLQQMVRLVDDLLDVSRITRGKITLLCEPTDIAMVVNHAVETSRPLIDLHKHTLSVALPQEPLWVECDVTRLAQVFSNLLNNAAKYTREGGQIWLTVAQEGDEVVVRVRDSGIGIPPAMLAKVFDLFIQVDRTLDRSQGGLGIGLTLVRRLVEMHRGTVQATSAGVNQGSEFAVRLPLAAAPVKKSSNGSAPHPPARRFTFRILVVDDNVDGAESLAVLLRVGGHDVRVAHDGPSALTVAAEHRPEVVLLDIGLPGLDGYEVARRMRREPDLENCLLIAITGYGRDEDRRRSLDAGFDAHLVKPIDANALSSILMRTASARQRVATLA